MSKKDIMHSDVETFEDISDSFYDNSVYKPRHNGKLTKEAQRYRDELIKRDIHNRFGNKIKNVDDKLYIEKQDAAYIQLRPKLYEIMESYIDDVKGYVNKDNLILYMIYRADMPYEVRLDDLYNDIALPVAIHICDLAYLADKEDDLKELIKDIEYDKEKKYIDVLDGIHDTDLLLKVAQVVYDHNKDLQGYDKDHILTGIYTPDISNKNYKLYKSILALLPEEKIMESIDAFKEICFNVFSEVSRVLSDPIAKTAEMMAEADRLRNDIINLEKSTYSKTDLNVLSSPQKVPFQNISADKLQQLISMKPTGVLPGSSHIFDRTMDNVALFKSAVEWNDTADDINSRIGNIQYIMTQYHHFYNKYEADNIINQMPEHIKDNLATIVDECPKYHNVEIANPYSAIAGFIFAIDNSDPFAYVKNICAQSLKYIIRQLPWNVSVSPERYEQIIKYADDDFEFIDGNNYSKDYVSKTDGTYHNYAQILYQASNGYIMPRYDEFKKSASRVINDISSLNDEHNNFDMIAGMSNLARYFRLRIAEAKHEYREEAMHKAIKKVKIEDSKEKQKSITEANKTINAQRAENHKLKTSLEDVQKQYQDLQDKYDQDMRELFELRELMFKMQTPETDVLEKGIVLPYTLNKATVIFGGHSKWIASMEKSLRGNIKFYESDTSLKNSMINNADIVYIQIKYISHPCYFGVVDLAKKLGIKLKFFNTLSINQCLNEIIQNDRETD